MSEPRTLQADRAMRLDVLLAECCPYLERDALRQLIQSGQVLVNDAPALKPGQYLQSGDRVVAQVPPPQDVPQADVFARSLQIVYEDEAVLVLDKPAGVSVRRERGEPAGLTLARQVAEQFPASAHLGGAGHSGLLTQLDREASGLLLAAKTEAAYRELKRALKRHRIERLYTALVEGRLRGEDTITNPIGNVQRTRRQLAVTREGRPASTYFRVQRHYKQDRRSYTLLLVRPDTARRHQIRVHLAWYGAPLVGDRLYGSRRQLLLEDRIFLHLGALSFPHPLSGETVRLESGLPAELRSILQWLNRPK